MGTYRQYLTIEVTTDLMAPGFFLLLPQVSKHLLVGVPRTAAFDTLESVDA